MSAPDLKEFTQVSNINAKELGASTATGSRALIYCVVSGAIRSDAK